MKPDVVTYNVLLNVCAKACKFDLAQQILEEMAAKGIERDVFTLSTMIDVYAAVTSAENCRRHFDACVDMMKTMKSEKEGIRFNKHTYTTLIKLCSICGMVKEALWVLDEMERDSCRPNVVSYNAVLATCAKAGDLETGEMIFDKMKVAKIQHDAFTFTAMIDIHAEVSDPDNCDWHWDSCIYLLGEMEAANVAPRIQTYNALIKLCCRGGMTQKALWTLETMKSRFISPTTLTYNSLLDTCAKAGNLAIAINLWDEMEENRVRRDVITYTAMINNYAEDSSPENSRSNFEICQALMEEMDAKKITPNVHTFNTLIKVCTRGGLMEEAMQILESMKEGEIDPDVITYTTLIDGFAKASHPAGQEIQHSASLLLRDMENRGVIPNVPTFNSLINLCAMNGDLDAAERYLEDMKRRDLEPNEITHCSMSKCRQKWARI